MTRIKMINQWQSVTVTSGNSLALQAPPRGWAIIENASMFRVLYNEVYCVTCFNYTWSYRFLEKCPKFWRRHFCPACRTYEIATRFWEVVICPIYMCLTLYEFSFILFDLCLFITIFNFILNYVLIVIFWIFTYYKIWIMLIIYCFIWNYWFFYFVTCLEVFLSVMS